MRRITRAATVKIAVVIAVAAAAGVTSIAASSAATGRAASSSSNTVDFYSSLPMQGASSAQTVPIVNAIRLALKEAGQVHRPSVKQVGISTI